MDNPTEGGQDFEDTLKPSGLREPLRKRQFYQHAAASDRYRPDRAAGTDGDARQARTEYEDLEHP
ncbi:hypothetical protein D3C73_1603190 [compost metagenome]